MEKPKYPITNHTVVAATIECNTTPNSNAFTKCKFADGQGVAKEIDDVAFFYVDTAYASVGAHRGERSGGVAIAVKSDRSMACDVMGERERGLTVRCRE